MGRHDREFFKSLAKKREKVHSSNLQPLALSKHKEDRQPSAREFFAELSDGGRVTVESHHDSNPGGSTGTSAMAQVPDFAAAAPAPMMSPPIMGGPVIAAVPPAPMGGGRGNKSGGGKGLVSPLSHARRDDHWQMSRPRRNLKKVEQSDNREQKLGALRHFLH